MDELVRVMKALSDPGRVGIVKLLCGRELCACEIIDALGLAQPTVSRHMKVLADAGLITGRKVGPWVHYRLAANPASPYAAALLAHLATWLEEDPGVAALRELSGDLHQFKAVRAEATYQLASLAASAGRADEVQKLSVQVMQIDPNSSWAQRAFALQARVPAASAAPAQPVASPKPASGR